MYRLRLNLFFQKKGSLLLALCVLIFVFHKSSQAAKLPLLVPSNRYAGQLGKGNGKNFWKGRTLLVHSRAEVEDRKPVSTAKKRHSLELIGKNWPVVFEDGGHSKELRDDILADIYLAYSSLSKYELIERGYHKSFWIEGKLVEATQFINFSISPGYYVPKILARYFGYILEINGLASLVVSRAVIEGYGKALTLLQEHEEAVEQITPFIDRINALSVPIGLSDNEVQNLFNIRSDSLKGIKVDHLRLNVERLAQLTVRYPSMLDFLILKEGDEGSLCCETVLLHEKAQPAIEKILLCHNGTQWQMTF